MRIEQGKRPDVLNTHLDSLRTNSAAGNWTATIAEADMVLELTDGRHPEALNHRGKGLRCIKSQFFAVLDFQKAKRLARKQGDQEQELIAAVGLVDAWRTSTRDTTFPFPERYQTEEDKRGYALQQAARWAKVTQSLIQHMSDETSEAKAHAYDNLGLLFTEIRNDQKALDAYIPAETILRNLLEKNPASATLQERLVRTIHLQGIAFEYLGRLPEAEAAQRKALDMSLQMGHRRNIGNAANGLSDVLDKLGRRDEARKYAEQANDISEKDGVIIEPEIKKDALTRLAKFSS